MSTLEVAQDALRRAAGVGTFESAQILSGRNASRVEVLLTESFRDDTKRRVCIFTSFKSVEAGKQVHRGRKENEKEEEEEEEGEVDGNP